MAYKQSPASFVKHKSKAVGYMAKGSAAYIEGNTDPNNETLVSSKTTKSRETTPEGIKGTRLTTESKFKTPGGEVKRTPEGDTAYAALSQEQKDAQDAKFLAKKRSELQTRFTPDAIKVPKQSLQSLEQKFSLSTPEKIDPIVGGGDYKFDISGKKPNYAISQETVQAFGGNVTGRYGQNLSDVEAAINKSEYDKTTKTGARNVLKISDTRGDFLPGRPESEKAMYLMNKEKAKESERLDRAYRSIGADNVTDEDRSNYKNARQNILNKYKKISSDITRSYLPISQGGGYDNRYTKRIKATSLPVYNSETGFNLFKNK